MHLNKWFSRRSIAESTHWMVLHRPVEPAALISHVRIPRQFRCNRRGIVEQRPRRKRLLLRETERDTSKTRSVLSTIPLMRNSPDRRGELI
jgi:hypothetical protein